MKKTEIFLSGQEGDGAAGQLADEIRSWTGLSQCPGHVLLRLIGQLHDVRVVRERLHMKTPQRARGFVADAAAAGANAAAAAASSVGAAGAANLLAQLSVRDQGGGGLHRTPAR